MLDRETFQTSNTLRGKEFEERERIVFISLSSRECALPSYSHNERGDISIGLSEATNLFECFLSLSLSHYSSLSFSVHRCGQNKDRISSPNTLQILVKYRAFLRAVCNSVWLVGQFTGYTGSLVFLDFSYVLLRLELGSLKSFPR